MSSSQVRPESAGFSQRLGQAAISCKEQQSRSLTVTASTNQKDWPSRRTNPASVIGHKKETGELYRLTDAN
jgi:hypothetical protein